MTRFILPVLFLYCVSSLQAQYLENFTGQNDKGLVNAICPNGSTLVTQCGSTCGTGTTDNSNLTSCTTIPPSFVGVNWTIVATTFFTDAGGFGFEGTSPDDFGVVSDRMQLDDPDQEICWVSPTLNIASAGAVSIAIDVSQAGGLEAGDFIRGDYSLNGAAYVAFETQTAAFAATQLNTSGLTGTTLSIRVCAMTNGGGEQIYFDNVSVPQSGVTTGCTAPTVTRTIAQVGSCNANSGAINVTASGGAPGYNVAWSGPVSGNPGGTEIVSSGGSYNITGLSAGTYTITVTDAASCSATTTASVTTATALSLSTQVLPTDCPGASTGEIDLTVSNGVPAFSYSWSNLPGAGDPQDQTGLEAGTYTVTVTDAAGCTATTSATVGTAAAGAYLETFSFDGKGILDNSTCSGADGTTCTFNNFVGVNWSIYGLSTLSGVDINDYFKTTGGKLEHKDIDQDVCWESPILDINPPGTGVGFSVALAWSSFDQEPSPDYIDVEYSLNGGSWTRVANQVGSGTSGHTIVYVNGSGNDINGSTTVNISGLTGSTLRIRVCGLSNSENETFTIDNVSVPLAQALACPQEINVRQAATNIADGGSFNYGNVNLGSNDSKVFTIENTGSFDLTLTGTPPNYVVKGGTNPGDFTITQPVGGTILGGGSTTFTVVFAPGALGGRSCTLTIGNNDSDEDPYNITLNGTGVCPAVTPTITGPTSVCSGGSALLDAGAGYSSYAWSGGGGSGQTANFTNITSPTTYTVTVTNANGCTGTDTHLVNVNANPAPTITGPTSVCTGGSVMLDAGAGFSSYAWSNAGGSGQTASFTNITSPTTYTVTVTNANGCTGTDTHAVSLDANLTPTITGPTSVCSGGSVMLDAGPGYTMYAWSGGGGSSQTATYTNITSPTTYTVTVTSNGCTGTDTHTVTVNSLPSCSISGADYVCNNSTGNVYSATGGMSSYSWGITSNGTITSATNGSSVTVTAGSYLNTYTVSVTITDANGCTSSCSKVSDIFLETPLADITVNPNPACFGVTLNLSITAAASSTVSWSGEGIVNPNGNPSTTALPTTTGPHTYGVTVTADNGCSNTGTASVTINPLPMVSCPGNSSVCSNVPAYALTGGSPGGGVYSGPGVSAGMFNPATAGVGMHTITYTVTDGSTGCTNSCTFSIEVTSCIIDFSGNIKFSNNTALGVNNALVSLTGSATASDLTDINGDFFISTGLTTGSFTLKPTKTINKLNGITVADATAIQQHVANSVPITDLYKQVAADVNKSNSISTLDASVITQSLLGNPAALAQFSTSWRFVPTSHTMMNPPWGFPEQLTYTGITSGQTNQNFYGMKTGDVVVVYANPANFGAGDPLVLRTQDRVLQAGETFSVVFNAGQLNDLAAFQFALAFDPAQLEVAPVSDGLPQGLPNGLPLTADNFGLHNLAQGEIRAAWSQTTGLRVEEATPVFSLRFKALQSGINLSDVLKLDEETLPALSYTSQLAESKVTLTYDLATGTNDPASMSAVHMQVRPNPFREETTVTFTLPAAGEAQLRVLDVNGRELLRINNTYPAGINSEVLHLEGWSSAGVLYCELVTAQGSVVRKMVRLEK